MPSDERRREMNETNREWAGVGADVAHLWRPCPQRHPFRPVASAAAAAAAHPCWCWCWCCCFFLLLLRLLILAAASATTPRTGHAIRAQGPRGCNGRCRGWLGKARAVCVVHEQECLLLFQPSTCVVEELEKALPRAAAGWLACWVALGNGLLHLFRQTLRWPENLSGLHSTVVAGLPFALIHGSLTES